LISLFEGLFIAAKTKIRQSLDLTFFRRGRIARADDAAGAD
jgi:hypothetical protein